ncbi:hypothetical protein DYB26_011619, partial [Aphanomyces astaci]
ASECDIECLRLRTKLHEMIIAQYTRFTLVVLQVSEAQVIKADVKVEEVVKEEVTAPA